MSDTPETDAFEAAQHPMLRYPEVLERMRMMERQCDDARRWAERWRDTFFSGDEDVVWPNDVLPWEGGKP